MKRFGSRGRPDPHEGFEVNERIRASVVKVIDETGENLGEMSKQAALDRAQQVGLDLVKVGEKDDVATVKILDFGKFLYTRKKNQAEAKKHQKVIHIKEIKMQPKIGVGDYETKISQAAKFLQEGKRVKFTLQFRGRQAVSVREVGQGFFARITGDLEKKELGTLIEEKEMQAGPFWSKIFYLKQ